MYRMALPARVFFSIMLYVSIDRTLIFINMFNCKFLLENHTCVIEHVPLVIINTIRNIIIIKEFIILCKVVSLVTPPKHLVKNVIRFSTQGQHCNAIHIRDIRKEKCNAYIMKEI